MISTLIAMVLAIGRLSVLLLLLVISYTSANLRIDEYMDYDISQSFRFCSDPLEPRVWVYRPLPKHPYRHFASIRILLNLSDVDARLLQSQNRTELVENLRQHNSIFGFISRVITWHSASVNPFRTVYLGVITDKPYRIKISIQNMDIIRVLAVLSGGLLYVTAHKIVRRSVFYYSSGTVLGVLASLLIIVFMMSKYVPARSAAVSVLVGGWSFSLYVLYSFCRNITAVLLTYQKWVAVYMVTSALVSFAICYRFGPPKDARSINLNQWGLQLVALGLVYSAGQVVEASCVIILVLITYSILPSQFFRWFSNTWRFYNPKPRKLLTVEEFEEESRRETARALSALKGYCSSPKCDSWRTVAKLSSPTRDRFIEFIADNKSHLSDDELMSYDSLLMEGSNITDDESDEDDSDLQSNGIHHRTFNGYTRKSGGTESNYSYHRHSNLNNTVHDMRKNTSRNYRK